MRLIDYDGIQAVMKYSGFDVNQAWLFAVLPKASL